MTIHTMPAPSALAAASLRFNLPEDAPVAAIRAAISDHIEALISYLDDIDGDPDLEPDADAEPSLGSLEKFGQGSQTDWGWTRTDDTEVEHDGAEPDLDGEMTISWPESFGRTRQLSDEGMFIQAFDDECEFTALERAGKGFVRCAPDDAEDSHDAEAFTDDAEPDV